MMMSKVHFLEFEKELSEIFAKIEALETSDKDLSSQEKSELIELRKDFSKKTAEIYSDLTPWRIMQIARHPDRPYMLDYVEGIFDDFIELHGDRQFADDASIIGGFAHLGGYSVMLIGHQKGRDTRERTRRNFGMTRPEGYRKALRLMKLAEKFNIPVITFIDTPGAYPGIDAEERNQSEAIGRNIFEMTRLKVPVISTIIGEGGSGGALALGVADAVLMLQYAIYSVISPEGCASILWKDAAQACKAAQALSITSDRLYKLGLVDKVISEPIGGAHRDPKLFMVALKRILIDQLRVLLTVPRTVLLKNRYERLMRYGDFERRTFSVPTPSLSESELSEPLTVVQKTGKKTSASKRNSKTSNKESNADDK